MRPRSLAVALALMLTMTMVPSSTAVASDAAQWQGGGDLITAATTVCVAPDGDVLIAGTEVVEVPSYTDLLFGSTDLTQAFIMRLSPALDVRWKVSIGGAGGYHDSMLHGIDAGLRMTVLEDGSAVLVGATSSENGEFPITPDAIDGFNGQTDGFVVVVDELGQLTYGTYVGGDGLDALTDVSATSEGIVVVGGTNSSSIAGVTNPHGGEGDAFVATLTNDDGWALDGLEFIGSTGTDAATCVSVDDGIYVGGLAGSGFPADTSIGPRDGRDAFVVRMSADLTMMSSLVIGGSGVESPVSIVADGAITLVGASDSTDLVIDGRSPDANGDCMVVSTDATLTDVSCTFLGGSASDVGTSVVPWANGRVLVGGLTNSSDLPVTGSPGPSGQSSGLIAVLNTDLDVVTSYAVGASEANALVAMCAYGDDAMTVTLTSEEEIPIWLFDDLSSLDPSALLSVLADTDVDISLERTDVPDVPGRVTSLAADPGLGHVLLSWAVPEYIGDGDPIRYEVARSDGAVYDVAGTTYDDASVTNGVEYGYTVRMVTSSGEGEPSTVEAIPGDVPSSPTGLVGETYNSYVSLTWSAPSDDGGCSVSAYTVRRDGGALASLGPTVTSFVDEGMANGVGYEYTVTATNVIGDGDPAAIVLTPVAVPQRAAVTASAGDGSVTLTWSEPDDGGHAITSYRVYRVDGSMTLEAETTSTSYEMDWLENGRAYSFAVSAINSLGEGRPSEAVSATPWAPPSEPTSLVAEPGDSSVLISWSPPGDDGGFPVTSYSIERSYDGVVFEHVHDTAHTTWIDDVPQNGEELEYRVSAVTEMAAGPFSETNVSLPETTPSQPSSLTAESGESWVRIEWAAPEDDGGPDVTSYVVERRSVEGNASVELGAGARSYEEVVVNGVGYVYSVYAVNVLGDGRSATVEAHPGGVPSEPTDVMATVGGGWVNVSWSPPADDGGWPLLRYEVTGDANGTTDASWFNATGLVNGVEVTFSVRAVNVVGPGPWTNVSATPIAAPSAPEDLSAVSGSDVMLSWTAPLDDGGSPVTSYVITRDDVDIVELGADSLTYVDEGAPKGEPLTYSVKATNAAGAGDATELVFVHTTVPSAPTGLAATVNGTVVTVTWDAVDDGGSPLMGYEVSRDGSIMTIADTSFEDGAQAGTVVEYSVRALNAVGASEFANVSVEVPAVAPSEPENVTVTRTDGGTLITWDPPRDDGGGEVSYTVMRGDSPDDMRPVAVVNGTSFLDTVDGACYAVVAMTSGGCSDQVVSSAPANDMTWVAIPVVALAAVVAVLLWRRR